VILQVAGGSEVFDEYVAMLVVAGLAETFIGKFVVLSEVEAVLDERGAGVGIVADTVAADPGVHQR